MKLRMSKAPAVCRRTRFSSGSGAPSRCWSLMSRLLSEQEVEDDDEAERDAREWERAPVPRQPDLLEVDEVLPRRLRVDEPAQLGSRLGLRDERDDDAEHDVDDEGRRRRDEGRTLAADGDDAEAGRPEGVLAEEGHEHGRERSGR